MTSKTKSYLFKALEVICLLTPMLILIICRSDKWFQEGEPVQVSIGFILCMVVVFVMLMGYAKKIKAVFWSAIFLVITYELKSIIDDAYMIFTCSTIGLALSLPFKVLYGKYHRIAVLVDDEYLKTYAREDALKEINKESD